jgi:hypothetical protein
MGKKLSGKDLIKLGFPKNNSINVTLGQINRYQKRVKKEQILIEAKKVLLNPKKVLKKLCSLIGISFDKNMLHWSAGSRPEDGVWAQYWYNTIHKSTGYLPYTLKLTPFPEHLKLLLKECLPHYEKLNTLSLG